MGGRRPTKENTGQATPPRTPSRTSELSDLRGVREVSRGDKRTRFSALPHHVTTELLRDSYYALKRDAAPGVDGVTWQEYETDLDEELADLQRRVHRGTYRAQPSNGSAQTSMLTNRVRDCAEGDRAAPAGTARRQETESRYGGALFGIYDRGTLEPGMKADLNSH